MDREPSPAFNYGRDTLGFALNRWLRYGASTHSSIVTAVEDDKPATTTWKMHSSGVYTYNPGAGQEWNMPYCKGTAETGKTLAEQDWEWDIDYLKNPTKRKDD